jgi:hypothetical protein
MIAALIFQAIVAVILYTLLCGLLTIQTALFGSPWVNVAILVAALLLIVNYLVEQLSAPFQPRTTARPADMIFGGLTVSGTLLLFSVDPNQIGTTPWIWQHPNAVVEAVFHSGSDPNAITYRAWRLVIPVVFSLALLTAAFGTYLLFADEADWPVPREWANSRTTRLGVPLYTRVGQLENELNDANTELKSHKLELDDYRQRNSDLASEITTAEKTETALRQELIKASVDLERLQAKLSDAEAHHQMLIADRSEAFKKLSEAEAKLKQQDDYIVLLLKRIANANQSDDGEAKRDHLGYAEYSDNPFHAQNDTPTQAP